MVLIVVSVFLLWPDGGEEPRAREYRDVTACLLTDSAGVQSAEVNPVWAGMQDASLKTLGQARYLSIGGDQDVANARSYVNTLILGNCAVIVAAGRLPVQAVAAVAREHPNQRFVIVVSGGSTPASDTGNVSVISALDPDATRVAVSSSVAQTLSRP